LVTDLEIAKSLAEAGVPIFVYNGSLPTGWQKTEAKPAYVDTWKAGRYMCAVMGQGVDVIDVDPRNGGSLTAIEDYIPESIVLGYVSTPSGGTHIYIKSLGLHSKNGFLPGIDYKGGGPDGQGRGFVYLPPSRRESKVDGLLKPYRWLQKPDLSSLGGPVLADSLKAIVNLNKTKAVSTAAGEAIHNGARNDTLTQLAGAMRRRGSSESAILAALRVENSERVNPPLPERELVSIAKSVGRYAPESYTKDISTPGTAKGFRIVSIADVEEEKIEFLDFPRFPKGKITMLSGDPGLGKSELVLALAAKWKCKTLFVSAEDAAGDTIKARFRKLRGDESSLYVLEPDASGRILDLGKDLGVIDRMLGSEDFDLLVLDPLNAFLPGVDIFRDNQVRVVLGPLAKLAERHRLCVVCLRHLAKGSGDRKAIYQGIGSIGFTGAARSELLAEWSREENETGIRILHHIKSNVGPLAKAKAFTIYSDPDDPHGQPLFAWLDERDIKP
jgi:hypothetical protein